MIMPQLAVICTCEVRNNPNFQSSGLYEISPPDVGFLKYEPGLIVTNSVVKMNQDRIIPVMVVKSTNKTFSIKKSNPIAKNSQIQGQDIMSVDKNTYNQDQSQTSESFNSVDLPDYYREQMLKSLNANANLFAQKDSGLNHTDTIK